MTSLYTEEAKGERNDILQVCVVAASQMRDDADLVHPMVRYHVLNETTGKYLKMKHSSGRSASVVSSSGGVDVGSEVERAQPVATKPCSLADGTTSKIEWNDVRVVDVPFVDILSPDVVILFEIIDFKSRAGHRRRTKGRDYETGLCSVAWAFLRPVHVKLRMHPLPPEDKASMTRKERLAILDEKSGCTYRLQLFEYVPLSRYERFQAETWELFTAPPPPASPQTPAVFLQYLRMRHRPLKSTTLTVRVCPIERPEPTLVTRRPELPTERETSDEFQRYKGLSPRLRHSMGTTVTAPSDARSRRASERTRHPNEACVLPDRLLTRFVAGSKGAFALRFSPTGVMLAVACCETHVFPIRIFDVAGLATTHRISRFDASFVGNESREGAILVAELQGHHGIVYDMRWSRDERHLLTASADATAKLWTVGLDKVKSSHHTAPRLDQIFQHGTTYVYSAALIGAVENREDGEEKEQKCVEQWQRVVTGAHDGSLRYWEAESGRELGVFGNGEGQHQGMINAIQVDGQSGRIYSGDSFGRIMIWKRVGDGSSVADFKLLRALVHPDIARKSIVSLTIHPRRRRGHLLVRAHQNCLKLLDLTTNKVVSEYKGSVCQSSFARAALSPDGKFVVSGSEDGHVYFWDCITSEPVPVPPIISETLVQDRSMVCDVAWHPTQHVVALACYGTHHRPILVYSALRPDNPEQIVFPARKDDVQDAKKMDPEQRKLRLKELQERRRRFLAESTTTPLAGNASKAVM